MSVTSVNSVFSFRLGGMGLGVLFLCLASLLPPGAEAQRRRPLLRPASRDQFAGRFVLIPRHAGPRFLQQPKMLAEVADHDLVTPPFRSLGNPAELLAWAKSYEYANVDGVIVSLDVLGTDREALARMRAERPGMPVYGFLESPTDEAPVRAAAALVAEKLLDYALVTGIAEPPAAPLGENVGVDDGRESAALLLLTRMLNRRFGFSPRFAPVYSAGGALNPADAVRRLNARMKVIDGAESPRTAEAAGSVDGFLFIHAPQTGEAPRQAFVQTMAQALEKGARVALIDLSDDGAAKESLIAALRREKLLDKIFAYASASSEAGKGDALDRGLTHLATLVATVRFMRDDLPRLKRIDRAQITLLFNRYLTDWLFALRVRPEAEAYLRRELRATPENLGDATEQVSAFLAQRIKPLADEIFNEQFRRNLHSLLMSGGERVIFEVGMLQRLQVRFSGIRLEDAEILQSVYVPQVSYPQRPPTMPRTEWTLLTDKLDPRVFHRIDATVWDGFKADAETVELAIALKPQEQLQDGFRLSVAHKRRNCRIDITASTEQGAFYAVSRLEQLGADGRLTEDLQLTESPAFAQRGIVERFDGPAWSHADRLAMIRFLGRVRMNRYVYAPTQDPLVRERWRDPYPDAALERLAQLAQVANQNFVDFVYGIEPGTGLSAASEDDWQTLARKLDAMTEIGIRHFALFAAPSIDAGLVNRIQAHLAKAGAALTLFPADRVRGGWGAPAEALAPEVALAWAGAGDVAREQTAQWRAQSRRRPILWDEYPGIAAKPWRLFLGPKRGAAPDLSEDAAGFYATPMSALRASWLPLATTAEYAWSGKRYDPTSALNGALDLLYDERARARVRLWEQIYGDAAREPNLFDPLHQPGAEEIPLPRIEQRLADLQNALDWIAATREQGLLRGELARILERNRAAVDRIKTDRSYERLPNGNYRVRKS